jgi:hypothetical protein
MTRIGVAAVGARIDQKAPCHRGIPCRFDPDVAPVGDAIAGIVGLEERRGRSIVVPTGRAPPPADKRATMTDLLKERGRGEEADHFRREDAKLIAKIRERARVDEIAKALAAKLRVDNAELLRRVGDLGLDRQTASAILLAPLVQLAWVDGRVTDAERKVVVELAESRGVTPGTPPHDTLLRWLKERPSDALFETATEVMRVGFAALPPTEREEHITSLVEACRRVAEASGSGLARLLGWGDVSGDESVMLDAIAAKLHGDRR